MKLASSPRQYCVDCYQMNSGRNPANPLSTVEASWQEAVARGLARTDAQMLLLHALGRDPRDRAWLIGHDGDPLPPGAAGVFERHCNHRLAGVPVAYLTGRKAFYGLDLAVDARVLDPRPDTETLVDWALEMDGQPENARVIDLGTGSGAIALALKAERPLWQVHALDASPEALEVAAANGQRLGFAVHWSTGHWLAGRSDRFDLVVSNPPYVAQDDAHLALLQHEPLTALVAGADGLDDLRTIVAQAPAHLQAGGWLMLEHGHDQADAVANLLVGAGFAQVSHRKDLAGIRRCTGGRWMPPALTGDN